MRGRLSRLSKLFAAVALPGNMIDVRQTGTRNWPRTGSGISGRTRWVPSWAWVGGKNGLSCDRNKAACAGAAKQKVRAHYAKSRIGRPAEMPDFMRTLTVKTQTSMVFHERLRKGLHWLQNFHNWPYSFKIETARYE